MKNLGKFKLIGEFILKKVFKKAIKTSARDAHYICKINQIIKFNYSLLESLKFNAQKIICALRIMKFLHIPLNLTCRSNPFIY